MKSLHSFLLVAATIAAGPAAAERLGVDVASASMLIAPGVAERRAVRLPGLDLDVLLDVSCRSGWLPDTVTLSSADTRRELSGDALAVATTEGTRFTIPARQMPPLSSRGFCVADEGLDQPLSLIKPGFVSLYATLRCRSEGDDEMAMSLTTKTTVIDVRIDCKFELLEADQDSSDSTVDRNSSVRSQD